jgi:hypothetical protein
MDRIRDYFTLYGQFDGEGNPKGLLVRTTPPTQESAEEYAAMQAQFARLRAGEGAEPDDAAAHERAAARARMIDEVIIPNL